MMKSPASLLGERKLFGSDLRGDSIDRMFMIAMALREAVMRRAVAITTVFSKHYPES